MDPKLHLKSVHIDGFGPFTGTAVPLEPITVLVGPNGAGKSAVLRAIACFTNSGKNLLQPGRSVKVALEFSDEGRKLERRDNVTGFFRPDGAQVSSPGDKPYTSFASNVQLFDLGSIALQTSGQIKPNAILDPTFKTLVSVLDSLKDENPDAFKAFEDLVKGLIPEIKAVTFSAVHDGQKTVVAIHAGGERVPFLYLSTGTKRIMMLAALITTSPPTSCLLLEEPEAGLHPAVIGRLVATIRGLIGYQHPRGTTLNQIILTTHSPWVYVGFRDMPQSIVVLNTLEDAAKAKRLTEMEDYETLFADGIMIPLDTVAQSFYLGDIRKAR